jgi:hypothetical protein
VAEPISKPNVLSDRSRSGQINTEVEPKRTPPVPTSRDDAVKLVTVANVALVGVPAAYATSGSVLITAIAAVMAVLLVAVYLRQHRRS